MRLFAAVSTLTSILLLTTVPSTVAECEGETLPTGTTLADSTVTQLDFSNANVIINELHIEGGELRFGNIGVYKSKPIDLKVTITSGDYHEITTAWDAHSPPKIYSEMNGLNGSGKFGRINLQTVNNFPQSGLGNFKFCLIDHDTNQPVELEQFSFTIYDEDERGEDIEGQKPPLKEKMLIDMDQVHSVQLWPNEQESQIELSCEGGEPRNIDGFCDTGRMIFSSSESGDGPDNPNDPNQLTEEQKQRSVRMVFKDTSCWEFSYDHYCEADQVPNLTEFDDCKYYSGGYFLFSGESEELRDEGECTGCTGLICCDEAGGVLEDDVVTKLDFYNSDVTVNTLHQQGGELRYKNVGTFESEDIDMVVTVIGGEYTNIEQIWQERTDNDTSGKVWDSTKNGKVGDSKFGIINLQTKPGAPQSGEGQFRFCFYKTDTTEPTELKYFGFTIYDEDERAEDLIDGNGQRTNGVGNKERLTIQTSQALVYQVWPNAEDSEIVMSCEDGSQMPCAENIKTIFHSSTAGIGDDNPDDPNNLTAQQMKRSVAFTFQDTSCFDLTYEHYCPVEQIGWEDEYPPLAGQPALTFCRGYGGGNFLFSGESPEIIDHGQCIVPPDPDPVSSCAAPEQRKLQLGSTVQGTEAYNPYTAADVGLGVMKMCVRSSLGYQDSTSNFQEVNYIESLITIRYDLTAGFCVKSFAVEPKLRIETTANKANVYNLRAYLCQLYNGSIVMEDQLSDYAIKMPKDLTEAFVPNPTGGVTGIPGGKRPNDATAKAFNQGSLITICVLPDPIAYGEGIRMNGLTSFEWSRPVPPQTQEAIVDSDAAGNYLTSYEHAGCTGGQDYCKFSSILFADFYRSKGTAVGSGTAQLQFATTRRRLGGHDEVRKLQEDDTASEFGISVELISTDDGPGALKTAGGASLGVSAMASILALLAAAATAAAI